MHFLKLKFNVRPADPLVYLRLSILIIVIAIAAGLFLVLYYDFYQTIVQAETVLVLKQEVALKDLNLELFNKVKALNDYKQTPMLPNPLPDPFASTPVVAPIENVAAVATTTPAISD